MTEDVCLDLNIIFGETFLYRGWIRGWFADEIWKEETNRKQCFISNRDFPLHFEISAVCCIRARCQASEQIENELISS